MFLGHSIFSSYHSPINCRKNARYMFNSVMQREFACKVYRHTQLGCDQWLTTILWWPGRSHSYRAIGPIIAVNLKARLGCSVFAKGSLRIVSQMNVPTVSNNIHLVRFDKWDPTESSSLFITSHGNFNQWIFNLNN